LEGSLQFKYGTVYRDVIHTAKLDWCKLMNSKSVDNKVTWIFIEIVRDTVPSVIHPCPYQTLVVTNATVETHSLLSVFPTGDYKFVMILSNDDDANLLTVTIIGSLSSSNKDTFG